MKKKIQLCGVATAGVVLLTACNGGSNSTIPQNQNLQFTASGLTGSTCDNIAAWDAAKAYANAGTLVVRNGKEYKNNWWTQGNDPETNSGSSGSGMPWFFVTSCGVAPTPTPTSSPAPTTSPLPTISPSPIPTVSPGAGGLPTTSSASGVINYHLNLPFGSGNVEKMTLSANYTDLLISNYVAGALLGRMMHEKYPLLNYNRDYIYGSLFGQLLQENINTTNYESATDWINPVANERASLLASGQGGPYQINDYSKRLETSAGFGLINFVALQKGLGYTVEAQDSGAQTASKGPDSLDQKYFGPMAAAYFHYNDMNRLEQNNSETWGPQYKYFSQCMTNLQNSSASQFKYNMYDLILNAAYNAGTYSTIIGDYFRICAGMYTTSPEKTQIASVGDYSLSDTQYQSVIGTKEAAGSTFILYPRQIRIYLDQIYNQEMFDSTSPDGKTKAITGNNNIALSVQDIEYVFENAMGTLAYVNSNNVYGYISYSEAKKAFEAALSAKNISISSSLKISTAADKTKFFDLLDAAINNLATNLQMNFTATTQVTIGGSVTPTPTPTATPTTPTNVCPSNPLQYPSDIGKFASGSVVQSEADHKFYTCNAGVAAWCNSPAQWAYAPGDTSTAGSMAWTLYNCSSK